MSLNIDFDFDDGTYRHRMNGIMSVLHCHHYLCLTTRMAIQLKSVGGIDILKSTTEDTIYPLLEQYVTDYSIKDTKDRLKVGVEYYSLMGMGKMEASLNYTGGSVKLMRSHIDQGWLKKWGRTSGNVNYFTCGYIAAMYAVAQKYPPGSFVVNEVESIVSGKNISRFNVVQKNI